MTTNSGRLSGKVALISGTGGGQGRAAARIFAREGALVVGCDINEESQAETERLVREDGFSMTSVAPVDLSTGAGAKAWVDAAVAAHGGIDLLYNNASLPRYAPFAEMTDEDYLFTIHNELDVVWHSTQQAWPRLVERGGGAVLNIASIAAIAGLRDLPQAAHAASKGGVIGITRQLAAEGSSVGIRVNVVSPGVINSPPVQEILASGPDNPLGPVINSTAFRRPGEPEDIAYAALYLLSDEARWVSGAHLVVDGGSSAII